VLSKSIANSAADVADTADTAWMAWLGPCIGHKAFEVGAEVQQAFVAQDAGNAACFVATGQGKYLGDLAALARRRLAVLGVSLVFGNDGSDAWCTVRNLSQFFSHRGDRGVSGRFAASVWLA
jgi:polyphenol oxidase